MAQAWSPPGPTAVPRSGSYKPDGKGGHLPWSLQVVELEHGRIAAIHNYLNTELFAQFGLPPALEP